MIMSKIVFSDGSSVAPYHMKWILFAVVVAAMQSLSAATWTNATGSWDLSDPDNWEGGVLPTGSFYLSTSGTYNLNLQDVTFGGIWPNSVSVIDMTATPDRRLTLNGSNVMYPVNPSKTLEYRGGNVDFSSKDLEYGYASGTKLKFSGGVKVARAGKIWVRSSGKTGDHSFTVTDTGTEVGATSCESHYAGEIAYDPAAGDTSAAGVMMVFTNGSKTAFSGSMSLGGGWTVMAGLGTTVSAKSNVNVGNSDGNGGLHVTGGASLDSGTVTIYGTMSKGNNCEIVDNFGTNTTSYVYLGNSNGYGFDNRLVIGENGYFSAKVGYIYGTNNWIVCSNGTFVIDGGDNTLQIGGKSSDRSNGVLVYGPKADYKGDRYGRVFADGSDHRFVIDGGATVTRNGHLYLEAYNGFSNTLEVVNGATFNVSSSIRFERFNGSKTPICRDRVVVAGGAAITTDHMLVGGVDSEVVVSNASLNVTALADNTFLMFGNDDGSTNCALVLEGAAPKVTCGRTLYFNKHSRIEWRLPAGGYSDGYAPIEVYATSTQDNTLHYSIKGIDRVLEAMKPGSTKVLQLIKTTNGLGACAAAVAEAQEALPPKCTLYFANNGKDLYLKMKKSGGLMFIVK